ncbi:MULTISPECIES: pyridoxamine 5'-phosphate oxidase family protein [Mumia]|uniref:pyridoxamine 5'-phosphate oxidase family protein n=1 Tax=Mumia TaxID=1546255 RepID=UPI00141E303D|nr:MULTISPECIES: pyridoxamine 5'-phosphate oxidase family protein [unclassified Mumia]QMW67395.1 pyridoxamine 5'-phosphate oxidase family protein [Mumia sp. ZJ1417]
MSPDPPRTDVTRLPGKQRRDRAALDRLLDSVRVCHLGVVVDGAPLVVPTAFAREGDRLLLHGSTGSPWMRVVAAGAPVSVAVTALDGIVVARSTFESSLHYRSAVLFGAASVLPDDEQVAALDRLTDALIPGRAAEVRPSTRRELAATLVLGLPIERWSLKVSDGWPEDEDDDIAGEAWAGVVPLREVAGAPVPAPDLRTGITVPPSVRGLAEARHRTDAEPSD